MATSLADRPVTTPSGRLSWRQAHARLSAAQKSSSGAPAYARFVNRPLGRLFAATAYVLGRTPNQVTAVSALFTFAGLACIALLPPTLTWSALSAVLLMIGYGLDAADGQLSRLQGSGSAAGEFLDHTVDALKMSVLHLTILVSWYRFEDRHWLLLVPLAFQAVESVQFSSFLLIDNMRRAHRSDTPSSTPPPASHTSLLYAFAKLPDDYGLMCLLIGVRFWTQGFTTLYALMLATSATLLALGLPRRYREVKTFR